MIQKTFINTAGKSMVQVTFTLPDSIWADRIHLVGDFNGWDRTSHPFQRDRAGRWILTVELDLGRAYQFRYLRDGQDWMSESQADACVCDRGGTDNFVVFTDPNFKRYFDEPAGGYWGRDDRIH